MERPRSGGLVPESVREVTVDITDAQTRQVDVTDLGPIPQPIPTSDGQRPARAPGVTAPVTQSAELTDEVRGLLAVQPDQFRLYDVATGERVLFASMATCPIVTGPLPESLADLVCHPDDAEMLQEWRIALPHLPESSAECAHVRLPRGPGWAWYELRAGAFHRDHDFVQQVLVSARDIEDQVTSVQRLADSERSFRELFHRNPTAMCLIDEESRFVEVNDAACALLGRSRLDLIDTSYDALVHPGQRTESRQMRASWLADGGYDMSLERLLLHGDGHDMWTRMRAVSVVVEGRALGLITMEDITETRDLAKRVRDDGVHDPLTKLPGRRLLIDRLGGALVRARRAQTALAVFAVHVEGLKGVHDRHGREAGDDLIRSISAALSGALREHDTLGRLGSGEFVALCEDLDRDADINDLGQHLLETAQQPLVIGGVSVHQDASVGIAVPTSPYDSAEDVLRQAVSAMSRAKNSDSAQLARTDGGVVGAARASVEAELRAALDSGALELHAQPLVDANGVTRAVETLLRWHHPRRGLLAPTAFADVLGSADLAVPLAEWAVRTAVLDAHRNGLGDDVLILVDVPVRALLRPAVGDAAAEALCAVGRDPASLVLQVPEEDLPLLSRRGTAARALDRSGATLGIDRFGSEAGSVASLRRRAPGLVTLERGLLMRSADNPAEAEFMAGIVRSIRALGITTVAQGVESPAHLIVAQDCGVDLLQGSLVGRPGPWAALEGTAAQARVTLSVTSRLPASVQRESDRASR